MPELLGDKIVDETERLDRLESIIANLHARLPLLFPMAGAAKWLISDPEKNILEEVFDIRKTMSKKQPEARDSEIIDAVSETLLDFVAK